MPRRRRASRAAYRHQRLLPPERFDARSFRVVPVGRHRLIVGCPRGAYDAARGQCRVGTWAQALLHPQSERRPNPATCPPTLRLNLDGVVDAEGQVHPTAVTLAAAPVGVPSVPAAPPAAAPVGVPSVPAAPPAAAPAAANPRRRRGRAISTNLEGFVDAEGRFHPIRESPDYDPALVGEAPARRPRRRATRRRQTRRRRRNPPETVEIYPRVERVYARKSAGPWAGRYVHQFGPGARICGLPSGELLIRRGRCP